MLKLHPEQLYRQLNNKLHTTYLLLGNDPLSLRESRDVILQIATMRGFNEHHIVQVDNDTDWQTVFSICKVIGLFSSRKTLTLILPNNESNMMLPNKQLNTLIGLLHNDLLLIMYGDKLTKNQKNTTWFTQLAKKAVLVTCQIPALEQLPKWIVARARQHNLQIDESACQLLCYFYEGNLLALAQILDQFSLLWPDDKITLSRIKQFVSDASHFTPYHWIDALLSAKSRRALHILQYFFQKRSEPLILLCTLQRELLLLMTLKRQSAVTPLYVLFDKHHVWQSRRTLMTKAINRLNHDQLRRAIHLLTHIKLSLKQNYDQSAWSKLESLSLLLCNKSLSDIFLMIDIPCS